MALRQRPVASGVVGGRRVDRRCCSRRADRDVAGGRPAAALRGAPLRDRGPTRVARPSRRPVSFPGNERARRDLAAARRRADRQHRGADSGGRSRDRAPRRLAAADPRLPHLRLHPRRREARRAARRQRRHRPTTAPTTGSSCSCAHRTTARRSRERFVQWRRRSPPTRATARTKPRAGSGRATASASSPARWIPSARSG